MRVVFSLGEAFEDLVLPRLDDANAGVLHGELHPGIGPTHLQNHRALVRELERIAEQVHQHLHQAVAVGVHPSGQGRVQHQAVRQVHAFHAGLEQLESMFCGEAQVKGFGLNGQLPRLQLRVVQNVVDHRHQVVCRLACVVEHLEGLGLVLHTGQQQGVEAQDGIHGGAQLMAYGGNEMLPHGRGVLQLLSFGLELLLVIAAFFKGLAVHVVINQGHHHQHTGHKGVGQIRRRHMLDARLERLNPAQMVGNRHDDLQHQHHRHPEKPRPAVDHIKRGQRQNQHPPQSG